MDHYFMKMKSVQTLEHHEQRCEEKKESKNLGQSRGRRSSLICLVAAFRNRVAEICKAEVTTEESNGLIENAVMLLRGIIRTIKCHIDSSTPKPLSDESSVLPWLVEHAGCTLSRCQKGRDGKTSFERLHGKKPTQEFVPFGEKVLAKQITTDPINRMNPRYHYGIWLGMRNNSAECFIGNPDGVFRAREIRRLEPQSRWDAEAINGVIGVPWRMTDGKWTVDRPEVREDPIPIPPLPFEGARIRRERITKQDVDDFGATIGSPGCNAIKDNKRAEARSDRGRLRSEECLRSTAQGARRLDRRNEVSNEALAEEAQRGERATEPQQQCQNQNQQHQQRQNREKLRLNQTRIQRGDCS